MPWRLLEFIWRRKNNQQLWAAMVKALKEVSFEGVKYGEEPETEWLFTEVRVESMCDTRYYVLVEMVQTLYIYSG